MSNLGFLQLSRSFYKDSMWLSLPTDYRSIFMTILINCAWKEIELDDFGVKIILKPGQLLMTERAIISEAFPPTNDKKLLEKYRSSYHRSVKKFENLGFSYHETYHKKTLHTILRSDILECFVPTIVPNSYQTSENFVPQKNNKHNNIIKEQQHQAPNSVVVFSCLKSFICEGLHEKEKINITKKHIANEQVIIDAIACVSDINFVPTETLLKSFRAAIKGEWKPNKTTSSGTEKNRILAMKLEKYKHQYYQFIALTEHLEIVKGGNSNPGIIMYQMSEDKFIQEVERQGKIDLKEIFSNKGVA